MRTPAIRWLTALAVTAFCLWVFVRGWQIVRFEFALQALGNSTDRAEALRPWTNVSGIAFDAMDASLTPIRGSRDRAAIAKRHSELVEILSRRPLSAEHWVSLSAMRLATAQLPEKVVSALLLSFLTGANEGTVIPNRGAFGISIWELLPPDLRLRIVVDVSETLKSINYLPQGTKGELQAVLSAKSEQVRQAIRTELLATAGITQEMVSAVGL